MRKFNDMKWQWGGVFPQGLGLLSSGMASIKKHFTNQATVYETKRSYLISN